MTELWTAWITGGLALIATVYAVWLTRRYARQDKRREDNAALDVAYLGELAKLRAELWEEIGRLRNRVASLEADLTKAHKAVESATSRASALQRDLDECRERLAGARG